MLLCHGTGRRIYRQSIFPAGRRPLGCGHLFSGSPERERVSLRSAYRPTRSTVLRVAPTRCRQGHFQTVPIDSHRAGGKCRKLAVRRRMVAKHLLVDLHIIGRHAGRGKALLRIWNGWSYGRAPTNWEWPARPDRRRIRCIPSPHPRQSPGPIHSERPALVFRRRSSPPRRQRGLGCSGTAALVKRLGRPLQSHGERAR